MNIFALDTEPKIAAQYHNDRHVCKMLVESAQILSTANHRHGIDAPYKPTHENHPAVLWAGQSLANWLWLRELALGLYSEYKYRYEKLIHKSGLALELLPMPPSSVFPEAGLTQFAQCMPAGYRRSDPVAAYRSYYLGNKRDLASWRKRGAPEWWILEEAGMELM